MLANGLHCLCHLGVHEAEQGDDHLPSVDLPKFWRRVEHVVDRLAIIPPTVHHVDQVGLVLDGGEVFGEFAHGV